MKIDLGTYCPSTLVYEDGKQVGWFYEIHIRPDGDKRTECQVCGLKFAMPAPAGACLVFAGSSTTTS